jgi:hypothetical protein
MKTLVIAIAMVMLMVGVSFAADTNYSISAVSNVAVGSMTFGHFGGSFISAVNQSSAGVSSTGSGVNQNVYSAAVSNGGTINLSSGFSFATQGGSAYAGITKHN